MAFNWVPPTYPRSSEARLPAPSPGPEQSIPPPDDFPPARGRAPPSIYGLIMLAVGVPLLAWAIIGLARESRS